MFYTIASKIPFIETDNSDKKILKIFIIGSVLYSILHYYLYSSHMDGLLATVKQYLYYAMFADFAIAYFLASSKKTDDNGNNENDDENDKSQLNEYTPEQIRAIQMEQMRRAQMYQMQQRQQYAENNDEVENSNRSPFKKKEKEPEKKSEEKSQEKNAKDIKKSEQETDTHLPQYEKPKQS